MRDISHQTTLVFLPGWGFKASIWKAISHQFPYHKNLFIDLPTETNDILSAIHDQIPSHSILIAWSLSGMIATDLCLAYPDKYLKLITVSSTPIFPKDNNSMTFQQNALTDLPALMKHFQRLVNGKNRDVSKRNILQSHMMDSSESQTLLFYLDLLMQSDKREAYHRLNLPVLHIAGDNDYLIPIEHYTLIKQQYPQHRVKIIEQAGHIPFITHEDIFVQHVQDFINASET